jgi:3-deoxy-D-manno-octulosonate 8-phosphate phosphatase (KDO 8-P phosphatase)
VRLLILDVDGVLTDGGIILDNEGNELKKFHVRDGHGIQMLQAAGVEVAIITGRGSRVVELRAQELGIRELYQRCKDKGAAYEHLLGKLGLRQEEVAYMGDDVVDIPLLRKVGLPIAVADAHQEARRHALLITSQPGGRGAVREATDFIIKAKGLWNALIGSYLED